MPLLKIYPILSFLTLFFSFHSTNAQSPSKGLLHFDGSKDYINIDTIADTISKLDDFTIEFWMKANKDSQSMIRTTFFATNRTVGDNRFLIVFGGRTGATGNVIIYDENTGGSKFDIISSVNVGDNVCHHIAYSKKGSIGTLYIDGVLIDSHIADYKLSSYDRYSIGQDWDYGGTVNSDFYRGYMRDFRLWNHARTKTQILDNMNSKLTGNETGLIVLFHLNDGQANADNTSISHANDKANGYDGKLEGFNLIGNESNYTTFKCDEIAVVPNFQMENHINVYPNPSHGVVSIQTSFELSGIQVQDMFGNTVFSTTGSINQKGNFKLNGLASGYYTLLIKDEQENLYTKKLVLY